MTRPIDYLLIGGGLASATAAETLRQYGARGSILILAAEPVLPYHRPQLSKDFLLKDKPVEDFRVHSEKFYQKFKIETLVRVRATRLIPGEQRVETDRAGSFQYGKLLIATGLKARRLQVPGVELEGVHCLRTLADAERIRDSIAKAKRAVVVASSFVAMELAAIFVERGIQTTLIAQESLLYDRLESPEISDYFYRRYREQGVEILLNVSVKAFRGAGRVQTVETECGKSFDCDLVLVGIGAVADTGFLESSGLALNDGVVVNQYLESSLPNVYAAGDIARFHDPVFRRLRRIEHWDNALKQGRIAARNMLGRHESYRAVSYFYSDVLKSSFNFVGDFVGATQRVVRGSPDEDSFAVLYFKDQYLIASFLLGRPLSEDHASGSLILNRIKIEEPEQLSDCARPLSDWARQNVLILQGGGALGAFECGVVRALEEDGIFPDVVAGVSIGAFNAAIVASHPKHASQALEGFWNDLAVSAPILPDEESRRLISSWQTLLFGVPKFFRPRWMETFPEPKTWPLYWISLYDPTPIKDLLRKYVDFAGLKNSPVRLLVNAVNVETAEIATFDSYIEDITPDHLLASGSLPPGFPWTEIKGKYYWDGGIMSNSPLDQVIERCGLTNKQVYIVNLYPAKKRLPHDFSEVIGRRDEILYAERLRHDVRTRDLLNNFHKLLTEALRELEPDAAERFKQRPLYIETVGTTGPISIVRIVHEGEPGEGPSKDYEFSRKTVRQHIEHGYAQARSILQERSQDN